MKIYTSVIMDMRTGAVLHEESALYSGAVALCKGSGGSTTNTIDYAYNDRMATLSEEQQGWAREYYTMWQQHAKPYEIAQYKANMDMLPLETDLYKSQLQAAQGLLPLQTEASKKFLQQSVQGVDVNERMALATADAANAWKGAAASTARDNARLGVNPNSGRYQGITAALDTQKATQLAGARTSARVGAEAENYERLKLAAGSNLTGGMLQGLGFVTGS